MKTYQRQLPHLSDQPALPPPQVEIPQRDPSAGLSAPQIYTIVGHYWRQSAIIAAGLIVVLALLIKILPKDYTATATLIVNSAHDSPLQQNQNGGNTLADYVATQAELMGSRAVLLPVVDKLQLTQQRAFSSGIGTSDPAVLRDYAERLLEKSVEVDEGRGGQVLYVNATAENPMEAAAIANTIANVYLLQDRQRANDPVTQQAQLSTEELAQLRAKVTDAQTAVTAFRDKYGLTSLTEADNDNGMQALTTLQTRLLDAQNERRNLESQQAGQVDSGNEALASQHITALREELATLQQKLADLRPTLGPRHPQILGLEAQIRSTENSLHAALGNISNNTSTELMRTRELETQLTQAVAAQRTKVLQLRQIQDQGAKLQLELQSAQSVYKQALDGYDQVKFDAGQNFANVSLVALATPPVLPSKPKKGELLGLACLVSVGLGILIPLLYELWFDRRIRCRDDLERSLGVRVLAEMGPLQLNTGQL